MVKYKKEAVSLVDCERDAAHYFKMAKAYKNLYPQIYDFENLHTAYIKARKGKRYAADVLKFSARLEENLIDIQNQLIWKSYRPSPYRYFTVYEPKERLIAALPFRDRILHHALCNIIGPIFENSFIYDSYACQVGRGVLAGVNRTTEFLRRARRKWGRVYCLKGDISKFFYSIDHEILKRIIGRRIFCQNTINLMNCIIDSSESVQGIPIGNLTSQLWANIYLNKLDHFCKESLRIKLYLRYMDDFVILLPDKTFLQMILQEIKTFIQDNLRLMLNKKTQIFPVGPRPIDFLGYRIWPDYRLLRKANVLRTKRKFKKFARLYAEGSKSMADIRPNIMSWLGHCKHADTWKLRKKILAQLLIP